MPEIPTSVFTTQHALNNMEGETPSIGRNYLGLSGIGFNCGRAVQYAWRWSVKRTINPRTQRIFNTGHLAEEFMIADLRKVGIEVWGQQDEIIGFAGHWKGHIDGRCKGVIEAPKTEHLLEMKTMNDKNFKDTVKNGVQVSKPGYYAQMMAYMGYLELSRGLFMAYNKNDSSYYIERVKYDADEFAKLKSKQQVILEEIPIERIGNPRTWFQCKFCDQKQICLGVDKPVKSCRSCAFVDASDNGVWECSLDKKELTTEEQINACGRYKISDFYKV